MPKVARRGDKCSGHPKIGIHTSLQGSPDVFANGRAVTREGDIWSEGVLTKGSSTVFVNGKGCGRIGDSLSCGGVVATSCENVYAGG